MFTNRLEDLWRTAATDGASTHSGPHAVQNDSEMKELMTAWSIERTHSIEFELLLKQSRKMMARMIANGGGSATDRRRIEELIQAIDRTIDEIS